MSTVYEDIVNFVANNLKCSICFELFTEPVTLSCGHSYCLRCIQSHLSRGRKNCPQCRSPLSAKHSLRKSVALSNILDLQEAGGREMWNHVVTRTDHSNSYQTENTEDILVRRLEFLKREIQRLEALQAELNLDQQDGTLSIRKSISTAKGFSSSFDSEGGSQCADSSLSSLDSLELENSLNGISHTELPETMSPGPERNKQDISEVLLEEEAALDGLCEACSLTDSAPAEQICSQPAEFALLSFSPALGHRRLEFVPESRTLVVRSAFSPVAQNSRFDACQWMANQEFSTGRHYWDVDVSQCSGWAAGVAYPDLSRTEKLGRGPSSWCIERSSGRLSAWHNKTETPVKQECPDSIRVLVDMNNSCLSFWSLIDGLVELYNVKADFIGPVRPMFWLYGTRQRNSLTFPARVSNYVK